MNRMFELFKANRPKKAEEKINTKTRKDVLRMMKKIIHLTTLNDPKDASYYEEYFGNKFFRFSTPYAHGNLDYPLLDLKKDKLYSSEETVYWNGTMEQYNEVYNSRFNRFIQDDLMVVYDLLRKDRNQQYMYELNKYELTILSVLNILIESKETNNDVIPLVHQERIMMLLSNFIIAILKKEQLRIELEERMRQATNDSLTKQLDDERVFVENFLAINEK
jgi:hypothetical protein